MSGHAPVPFLSSTTTLPPQVSGNLIGDVLLSCPNLRWLSRSHGKPTPQGPSTTVRLSWWGESSAPGGLDADVASGGASLLPSVSSLGAVLQGPVKSRPPTVQFPILGGIVGLQRYLADMGDLCLQVFGPPPSSSSSSSTAAAAALLGVVLVQGVTTQGLDGLYPILSPSDRVIIGEVKLTLTFRLGSYGDSPACRLPSPLLTNMPSHVRALIDGGPPASSGGAPPQPSLPPSLPILLSLGAVGVSTSFQLNEAYALADSLPSRVVSGAAVRFGGAPPGSLSSSPAPPREDLKLWPNRTSRYRAVCSVRRFAASPPLLPRRPPRHQRRRGARAVFVSPLVRQVQRRGGGRGGRKSWGGSRSRRRRRLAWGGTNGQQ